MTRDVFCGVALAAVLLASPAAADVTVKATTGGKGLGQAVQGETTTYIKGTKMRADSMVGDRHMTSIIDATTQQMISIDHKRKEAEVVNLAEISGELKKITDSDVKVSMTPTGQSKEILGQMCQEYAISISVAASPIPDQKVNILMSGPVWIAKNSPGRADYLAFYKAAAENGLFFGDPRAAKAQPGQAKGMTALYEAMASAGVPYASEIQVKFEGSGMMAAMMNKMGGSSITNTVTSVSADPLEDALFEIPAGYKTKTR